MARDYHVPGECLVKVWGGEHIPEDQPVRNITELGLASDSITITPVFKHRDIRTDDFGPECSAEIMALIAEAQISMTLIHFDREALNVCMNESLGGGNNLNLPWPSLVPAAAGTLLGNGREVTHSGCHLMRLNLSAPLMVAPMRFLACYIAGPPIQIPIGTKAMEVELMWRAIPYTAPVLESGLQGRLGQFTPLNPTIWDNVEDEEEE